MGRTENRTAVAEPGIEKAAGNVDAPAYLPQEELDGMDAFGASRNWVSFDANRGVFTCRSQQMEYDEFRGAVIESHVVRLMKDEDGNVLCGSSDRVTADTGRPGRLCEECEDRCQRCFARWRIAWQDEDTGLIFAHTLSQTGSLNFQRFAEGLKQDGLLPSQMLTRIFIEDARRHKSNAAYRRVQFARLEAG